MSPDDMPRLSSAALKVYHHLRDLASTQKEESFYALSAHVPKLPVHQQQVGGDDLASVEQLTLALPGSSALKRIGKRIIPLYQYCSQLVGSQIIPCTQYCSWSTHSV